MTTTASRPEPMQQSLHQLSAPHLLNASNSRHHNTSSRLLVAALQQRKYVIMGGGRVTQVTSKAQWDQIMGENAGKAVRDKGGRGHDLLQCFRQRPCLIIK